jgi:hypothetical protein
MEVTDIWVKPFAVVEKALDDYRLIEILTLRLLIEYAVSVGSVSLFEITDSFTVCFRAYLSVRYLLKKVDNRLKLCRRLI